MNFVTSDSGLLVPAVTDDATNDRTDITFDISPATGEGWVLTTEGGIVGWAPASSGISSVSVAGDTPMIGAIELAAGAGVTLSQDDVDTITISASASGSGSDDGWLDDTAETWTYASGSGGGTATFTVTGDLTTKYAKGTRIKLTQTTVKYFNCIGSSHSAGTTTVTITGGSDYTLANAAISANYHSYQASPQGWPDWFNYTPTATGGFSGSLTVTSARFRVNSRTVIVEFSVSGTSNSSNFKFSIPITSAVISGNQNIAACRITDNGALQTALGYVTSNNSGSGGMTELVVYRDGASTSFTNSGTKAAIGICIYEI